MAENKQNALLWAIGGVLIILGVIYFSFIPADVKPGAIKIGVLVPLTGDAASYGTAMQRAYDLAVSEVNAAGGVNGKQLELEYEDSKCDGASSAAATERLIQERGAGFILGGTCSGETLAAALITQEARVLLLSPTSTSSEITNAGDLVFRMYPSDTYETGMIAAHAAKNGHTRAALLSEDTVFTQGVREAFKGSYSGTVVFDEIITGDTDFKTLMTKLRVANPQMVYLNPQSFVMGEKLLEQINASGMNVAVYANNAMLDRSAISADPSTYEEVVMTEVPVPTSGKASFMIDAYTKLYGSSPAFKAFTASAYDSVYLLAEAIGSVGEDPEAVAGYLNYKVTDWPGALGTLNFDENGDIEVELVLMQVVGGELSPISVE